MSHDAPSDGHRSLLQYAVELAREGSLTVTAEALASLETELRKQDHARQEMAPLNSDDLASRIRELEFQAEDHEKVLAFLKNWKPE